MKLVEEKDRENSEGACDMFCGYNHTFCGSARSKCREKFTENVKINMFDHYHESHGVGG